ncbi:MAG: outer membrane lipoprotein carrier protein LolA [Bacteroidetes bacterium]|nr:MAG: outer membrane lipoprotein carrier protein LolA [Bacteroidota bacterium]
MKKFLFSLAILGSSFLLFNGFVAFQSSADRILEESKTTLRSLNDFSADFTYELANPGMRNAVSKTGSLKYKQGKYVIKMDDQEIYCDLETLWIYLSEDNEVNIMDYDPEEGMDVESIFNLYETSSQARYQGEKTVNGAACHHIYLAIKDADLEYNQAYLWINKQTKMLQKISLVNRTQTTTTYEFRNMETNTGLTDAAFRFDVAAHSGVDVYDER